MARTIEYNEKLVVEVCWCGMHHAIPAALSINARGDGLTVYCPLGHQWVVTESEAKKEKRAREAAETRAKALADQLAASERSNIALRGARTKERKRIENGVCPCCRRNFVNLGKHMRGQHPHYSEQDA